MTYILTFSTFRVKADDFAESIKAIFPDATVEPLYWQISRGPQSIVDFFDARDGKELIVDVANKMVEHLQNAQKNHENVIIISRQAGSRIAEEALSIVKGLDKLPIEVKHIMLAPEISSSEWRSVGKFAGSALLMGLAGIALTQASGKKGLAAGVLGLIGGAALAKKQSISDRFSSNDNVEQIEAEKAEETEITESDEVKYADIQRFVFYNPEDGAFDGLTEKLYNGKFYKGTYSIEEITSLDDDHLEAQYKDTKFLRSVDRSKLDILKDIVK